jgi:histidine triad (HIT) family protein
MTDCIFCKIIAGQIKASVVYENQYVVAFRDINPQAPVHILVVPRKHIERLSEFSEADLPLITEIHRAALDIAKKENLADSGFRLVANNGKNAGQTVDHLHYHVMGGRTFKWPPG